MKKYLSITLNFFAISLIGCIAVITMLLEPLIDIAIMLFLIGFILIFPLLGFSLIINIFNEQISDTWFFVLLGVFFFLIIGFSAVQFPRSFREILLADRTQFFKSIKKGLSDFFD